MLRWGSLTLRTLYPLLQILSMNCNLFNLSDLWAIPKRFWYILIDATSANTLKYKITHYIVYSFRGLLFHRLLYSYLSSNPERFVYNIVVRVIQHLIKHIRMPTIIDLKHQYICNADGKLRIFSKWIKFHNIQQNKSLIYFANKLFIISLCSHNTIIQSLLQKKLWLLVKTKPKILGQKN